MRPDVAASAPAVNPRADLRIFSVGQPCESFALELTTPRAETYAFFPRLPGCAFPPPSCGPTRFGIGKGT
jgi:hypothetical protein